MITLLNFYHVMTAMVPLYVAMILAYGSVKWWKIFSPDQCSGINRFVALFAAPLLSFHFIASNNPYAMSFRFILADTLQKLIVLALLFSWAHLSKRGCLDWTITLFSLSTLPNTLVMGVPLLKGMYGDFSGSLMVQIVVLQCVIWYTLLLFLFEYRAARILITEQFPDTAGSIASIAVDPDVMSLEGGRDMLETEAEIKEDGKLHVVVRPSNASGRSDIFSRRSTGISARTPRLSNLSNAEIYSLQSSSFNHNHLYSIVVGQSSSFGAADANGMEVRVPSSRGPTPRPSNHYEEETGSGGGAGPAKSRFHYHLPAGWINPAASVYPIPNLPTSGASQANTMSRLGVENENGQVAEGEESGNGAVPFFDVLGGHEECDVGPPVDAAGGNIIPVKEARIAVSLSGKREGSRGREEDRIYMERDDSSLGNRAAGLVKDEEVAQQVPSTHDSCRHEALMEDGKGGGAGSACSGGAAPKAMPSTCVMTRLILIMVWRKLIRNPNTYSSLIGLIWSLVSFRWNLEMPAIVAKSISILSDTGLGMAMFSLGLYMALQPRLIACGNSTAAFAMAVRFFVGPAVMAAASIAMGLRGVLLRIAIVQAALPQGIVPFVFAKEYNLHTQILSTAVIFGMLVALPVTLVYYILLGI